VAFVLADAIREVRQLGALVVQAVRVPAQVTVQA